MKKYANLLMHIIPIIQIINNIDVMNFFIIVQDVAFLQ